jgi:hypothetical protein
VPILLLIGSFLVVAFWMFNAGCPCCDDCCPQGCATFEDACTDTNIAGINVSSSFTFVSTSGNNVLYSGECVTGSDYTGCCPDMHWYLQHSDGSLEPISSGYEDNFFAAIGENCFTSKFPGATINLTDQYISHIGNCYRLDNVLNPCPTGFDLKQKYCCEKLCYDTTFAHNFFGTYQNQCSNHFSNFGQTPGLANWFWSLDPDNTAVTGHHCYAQFVKFNNPFNTPGPVPLSGDGAWNYFSLNFCDDIDGVVFYSDGNIDLNNLHPGHTSGDCGGTYYEPSCRKYSYTPCQTNNLTITPPNSIPITKRLLCQVPITKHCDCAGNLIPSGFGGADLHDYIYNECPNTLTLSFDNSSGWCPVVRGNSYTLGFSVPSGSECGYQYNYHDSNMNLQFGGAGSFVQITGIFCSFPGSNYFNIFTITGLGLGISTVSFNCKPYAAVFDISDLSRHAGLSITE